MRLGILADIHESVENLAAALAILDTLNVDRLILLGDFGDTTEHLDEAVALFAGRTNVTGVWGNHDFGLCYEPPEHLIQTQTSRVMEFMTTLQPRIEIDDCLFTHVEPWLDPHDLVQLWYFDGPPDTAEKVRRSFEHCTHRVMFCGHFHRWMISDAAGKTAWAGEMPITLAGPQRFMVVVSDMHRGYFATYDTESCELRPYRIPARKMFP